MSSSFNKNFYERINKTRIEIVKNKCHTFALQTVDLEARQQKGNYACSLAPYGPQRTSLHCTPRVTGDSIRNFCV